jgi:hypothetical protein
VTLSACRICYCAASAAARASAWIGPERVALDSFHDILAVAVQSRYFGKNTTKKVIKER